MAAVRVMQVSAHEIVDVVPVRHGLVAAARSVDVGRGVRSARVRGRACGRIRAPDGDPMFVDMVAVHVVQVAVVEIVHVTVVVDGDVTAACPVDVGVLGMLQAIGHRGGSVRRDAGEPRLHGP
jgi:hypothetical protein